MAAESKEELFSAMIAANRANQTAVDMLDEACIRVLGINRTDGRCMDLIDQSESISAGELAEAAGLTTGAVTTVIDRLESAGYVTRVPDTTDRRRVMLEMTDLAKERTRALWGRLIEGGMEMAETYTGEDLELLTRYFRESTELTIKAAAEVRAEYPDSF